MLAKEWSSGAFVADVGWGGVNRTNEAEVECWGKNTEAGHTEDLEMKWGRGWISQVPEGTHNVYSIPFDPSQILIMNLLSY